MASIEVFGSAERSFLFPAPRPVAYEFYSSLPRIIPFLPRIVLVQEGDDEIYRVAYRSRELSVYDVDIPCDLRLSTAEGPELLRIQHTDIHRFPEVAPYATMRSCRAMGRFQIESRFQEAAASQTMINYRLMLSSTLPKPLGLLLVPNSVMSGVVERIVQIRINEIVDHFVADSVAAFAAENGR
ncbi:MAG: hypothetical protein KDE51_15105 [Anaerolineales bacterium]|nr:hypothetical protein [Anaerolineales bacterium]